MANMTENTLTVAGKPKDVKAFARAVRLKERPFDFDKVIRMPKVLRGVSSGFRIINGTKCGEWFDIGPSGAPTPIVGALRKRIMRSANGCANQYDWCRKNWGAQWNACHSSDLELTCHGGKAEAMYHFQTEWSAPMPVYTAASKRWRNLTFYLRTTDEGSSTWKEYVIERGKASLTDGGTNEPFEEE